MTSSQKSLYLTDFLLLLLTTVPGYIVFCLLYPAAVEMLRADQYFRKITEFEKAIYLCNPMGWINSLLLSQVMSKDAPVELHLEKTSFQ